MKYITIAVLALQAGEVLGLTDAQAAPRQHVLTPVPGRKGWYTTTGPTQFKRGEQFLYEGDLPKHLADTVDSADGQPVKAKAKAKAKTEAQQAAEAEAQAKADAEAAAAAETAANALAPDAALNPATKQD